MTVRIDQSPANVSMLLNRGDDMTPWTATFRGLNLTTGFVWFARILSGAVVVKTLTAVATFDGTDTLVTVSGLNAAESTALATSGLTYDLGHSAPLRRTYLEGVVKCD